MVNKKLIFHLHFFNKDFWLNFEVKLLKFSTDVKHIVMEGSVSQIFDLGLSFCFISKNG